eukprot:scaffold21511_cov133-Isochrysis_galbana.AAC.7
MPRYHFLQARGRSGSAGFYWAPPPWPPLLLPTPANTATPSDTDIDDSDALVQTLSEEDKDTLSGFMNVALTVSGSSVGKLIYDKAVGAAEHQMKQLPPNKNKELVAAADAKKKLDALAKKQAQAEAKKAALAQQNNNKKADGAGAKPK